MNFTLRSAHLYPLLLGMICPTWAAHAAQLQPLDVFELRQATAPSISPDGKTAAFILVRRDIMTDTKVRSVQISRDLQHWSELADSEGCGLVRWAPDSQRFSLVCQRQKQYVLEVRDRSSERRSAVVAGSDPITDVAWSPDGRQLAFERFVREAPEASWKLPEPPPGARWAPPFRAPVTRLRFANDGSGDLPRGSAQTFLITPGASSEPVQLTSGSWWTGFGPGPDLAWSADGSEVLLSANHANDWDIAAGERDIFAVGVGDRAVRRVTASPGAEAQPAVSPDKRWLAFTGVDERGLSVQNRHIYVLPTRSPDARPVKIAADFDRSIDQFYWLPDSQGFTISYEDAGTRILAKLSMDGKVSELARDLGGETLELPFSFGSYAQSRSGTAIFLRSSPVVPSEIAILKLGGKPQVLTHLNDALAERVGGFIDAEPFWVRASTDGKPIQAWIMRQRASPNARTPLILDIHGGPYAQYGKRFSLKYQLYLAAGYNVVYANPRGSTGYGEAFGNLAHGNWPGQDVNDLQDVVASAAGRDFVDPRQLFVTGTSGGATMTLWSVANSDRFSAAVASKPLVDWISWTLTSDFGPEVYSHWRAGVLPWEDVQAYWRRSALSLVPHIHTPVLLISGDDDLRAPAGQALEMFSALKLAGVETALVRGPQVSHNSVDYRPSMFLQEVAYTLGWFERHRAGNCRPQQPNCQPEAGSAVK